MMCYRDKTFCNAACANNNCSTKLTDKVTFDAVRWWGSDKAPISISDQSEGCADFIAESKSVMKRKKVQQSDEL